MHTDGSIFSFNVLLSDPPAFDGGGTFFEPQRRTVTPPRGAALGHSGQVRHSGVAITRGERYLLVGFVGCRASPYSLQAADWAAHDAWCKFGAAAWDRSPAETVATLIDTASDYALAEKIGGPVPTVDLRVDYHRTALEGEITVKARVIKLGRTFSTAEASVFDSEGRLLTSGRGVFHMPAS